MSTSSVEGTRSQRPELEADMVRPGAAFQRWLGRIWPVLALGLVGLGLRLLALERRSLWLDEILAVKCIVHDFSLTLKCLSDYSDQAPLYYYATYLFYRLGGSPPLPAPDWLLRLPEVVAGVLTIPFMWGLARELLGLRAAWVATALLIISPLAIDASQQVRPYAWLVLSATASAFYLVVALRRGSWLAWLGFGISAAAILYSQYTGALVLVAEAVFATLYIASHALAVWRERGSQGRVSPFKPLMMSLGGGLLSVGIVLVVAYPALVNILSLRQRMATGQYEPLITTPLTWDYLTNLSAWLVLGAIEHAALFQVTRQPYLTPLLMATALLGLVWMAWRRRTALVFCLCWLLIPTAYQVATFGMPATPRYLVYYQPGYFLLLAAGAVAVSEFIARLLKLDLGGPMRMARSATLLAGWILIPIIPGLIAHYTTQFDDWRGVASYLREHARPGDAVFSLGGYSSFAVITLTYYRASVAGALPIADVGNFDGSLTEPLQAGTGQIWGVLFGEGGVTPQELSEWGGGKYTPLQFSTITLLAPNSRDSQGSASEKAVQLLTAYEKLNPDRVPPLVALLKDKGTGGRNLVLNGDFEGNLAEWNIVPQGRVAVENNMRALVLSSDKVSENVAAIQQVTLQAGHAYALRFQCRNTLTDGSQRVFVIADKVFPDGAGYPCPPGEGWQNGAFVFQVPAATGSPPVKAAVWLRNQGMGDAYFRLVRLTELSSLP